jgi:hypothetical protein
MTRSAAIPKTLGQVAQKAIQNPKFRTSTQQISMTTKPTLDRIAITRNSGVNRFAERGGAPLRAARSKSAADQRLDAGRKLLPWVCELQPPLTVALEYAGTTRVGRSRKLELGTAGCIQFSRPPWARFLPCRWHGKEHASGDDFDEVPATPEHDPCQNHLLDALPAEERDRLFPHMKLVAMPLG